jgi:hypothetical protein
VWVSSRDGGLGTGESLTVAHLSVGEHEITLTASDAQGLTASAKTGVAVVARGGGGGATDMLALPGFQAAWEADSEGMSTHANGAEVSVWSETGGVFDVTAGSADGTKPTFVANAINGLPAVRFNGLSSQRFTRSAAEGLLEVTAADGLTIYAVVKNTTALSNAFAPRRTIVSQYNAGSATSQQFWLHRSDSFGSGYVSFAVRSSTGITTLNSPAGSFASDEWVLVTARFKDGVVIARLSGVQVAVAPHSGTISPAGTSSLNVGATHGGINPWGGDQAAVYVYNEGHDDETVAAVEAMLMAKYGLAP